MRNIVEVWNIYLRIDSKKLSLFFLTVKLLKLFTISFATQELFFQNIDKGAHSNTDKVKTHFSTIEILFTAPINHIFIHLTEKNTFKQKRLFLFSPFVLKKLN